MSLRRSLEMLKETFAEMAEDESIGDLKKFLSDAGLERDEATGVLMTILGNVVGHLVAHGVDPGAIGAAVATMGTMIKQSMGPPAPS